jgi:membrane protein
MMFKFMPNARTFWLDSFIGAAITTILFSFGRGALAWYFANTTPSSAYGAAGSLIAILLWVNYSAQIILYGAEFTHIFSQERTKQEQRKKTPPKNPYMP